MTGALQRRYVTSTLPGSIRCTDGTLVVFVPPEEGPEPAGKTRKPKKPAPAAPAAAEVPA